MTEIEQAIKNGEGKTVEFKANISDGNNIAKTVVSFSNTAGGKLIVGIEDKSHEISGISNDDVLDLPDRISNIIHERCYPFILPEIYIENIRDTKVLVVEVFPGPLKPYYIKKKGKKDGSYIRVGATNKAADMEMIMELERQKRNISFDEELDYELDEQSLDLGGFGMDFHYYTSKTLTQNDLFNMKILNKAHDRTHPSIGGLLLAGKTPYLEYARIKCARFRGNNMDEFIDQKDFSGPLYDQVEKAMKFAKLYIARAGKIEGLQRIDRDEVPLDVIREALVNAVVHRDYSISGADIKFAIFDNRIEITSPGALPRSLEIKDIVAGRSEIRNKIVARFFNEINFIEQWGTGIRKIIRLLKEWGLEPPQFKETGMFFKVIISKKEISRQLTAKDTPPITPKTTPKISARIIELLGQNPHSSIREIADTLQITEAGVKYNIKTLKEQGVLKRVGSAREGYWQVVTPHKS